MPAYLDQAAQTALAAILRKSSPSALVPAAHARNGHPLRSR